MIDMFLDMLKKQRDVYVFTQIVFKMEAGKDAEINFIEEIIGHDITVMLDLVDTIELKLIKALGVKDYFGSSPQ